MSKLTSSASSWTDDTDLKNVGFIQLTDTTSFLETLTEHDISAGNFTFFSTPENTRIWSTNDGNVTFCEIRRKRSVYTDHALWLVVADLPTDNASFKARKALTEGPDLEAPFVNQTLVTADTASFSRTCANFQGTNEVKATRIRGGMNRYEKHLHIKARGLKEPATTAPGFFATALNSSTEPY